MRQCLRGVDDSARLSAPWILTPDGAASRQAVGAGAPPWAREVSWHFRAHPVSHPGFVGAACADAQRRAPLQAGAVPFPVAYAYLLHVYLRDTIPFYMFFSRR